MNKERCILVTGHASFTLVELLMVITMLAVIMSLLSPSLHRAISRARTLECHKKLSDLMLVSESYRHDHNYYAGAGQGIPSDDGAPGYPSYDDRLSSYDGRGEIPSSIRPKDRIFPGDMFDTLKYTCPEDDATMTINVGPSLVGARTRSYKMTFYTHDEHSQLLSHNRGILDRTYRSNLTRLPHELKNPSQTVIYHEDISPWNGLSRGNSGTPTNYTTIYEGLHARDRRQSGSPFIHGQQPVGSYAMVDGSVMSLHIFDIFPQGMGSGEGSLFDAWR